MDAKRRLRTPFSTPVLLALIASTGVAQRASGPDRVSSPFVRLQEPAKGQAILSFGPSAYAALNEIHGQGLLARLVALPLPDGRSVDLLLRPTSVMEAGGKAVVYGQDGEVSYLAPKMRTFSASIPGRSGRAFLGISPTQMNGYVSLGDDLYILSTGGAAPGEVLISDAATLPGGTPAWCGVSGGAPPPATDPGSGAPSTDSNSSGKVIVRSTRIIFECDHEFRARFASDQDAIDYVVLLASAASDIYRRDLGVVFEIPNHYIQIYNTVPPWGAVSGFGGLSGFINWWNSEDNPITKRRRAAVTLLTNPVFGGVASGLGVVCQKNNSYQISAVFGSFPSPVQHTSGANWDLFVLGHELGHLYGSGHTFDSYSPPISCTDGSGPDSGTIMSYCHLDYGIGGVGMRFHSRVQDAIYSAISGTSCPDEIPTMLGDYDMNGVHNVADLAEFDAYLTQGFQSRGAKTVFDLNADGLVSGQDRDILEVLVNGAAAASATPRGVSTCNCGLISSSTPLLGSQWESLIWTFGPPTLTVIIGSTGQQDPGVMTKFGELFIQLPGTAGAVQVFKSSVTSVGYMANHTISLPYDLSLAGLPVYTQGVLFTADGPQLTNAVDLVLNIF